MRDSHSNHLFHPLNEGETWNAIKRKVKSTGDLLKFGGIKALDKLGLKKYDSYGPETKAQIELLQRHGYM